MKKNIMFIIGQMKTGGAERVIYNLCNNLKDKYNITLVVRTMEDADYIPDVNIAVIPELNIYFPQSGKNKLKRKFKAYCRLLLGLKKLKKLKKELKIDTSISFLLKSNIYNYLSKDKDKVIISVRNQMTSIEDKTYLKLKFLYKFIAKRADLIVNVSKSVMHEQINTFKTKKKKNIVIPNFCEYEAINKLKKEKLPKEHEKLFKGKTVISSGRYSFQKGQWHLIRAFTKVVEYDKNIKLVLTGRGKLKEYYQQLVDELNLQNNVFILDYVDNVYRYMYNSEIYILNSFYEGMPNVLLEAMACDLPIIATDAPGGTKEIISPKSNMNNCAKKITNAEYGILIPVCDRIMYKYDDLLTKEEEMLAESIILLFKDKKLSEKYKRSSNKRIKDFDKEKILKMWEEII